MSAAVLTFCSKSNMNPEKSFRRIYITKVQKEKWTHRESNTGLLVANESFCH